MNLGSGDYYSIANGSYVRHTNVQIIGIDSRQPYQPSSSKQLNQLSDKEIDTKSVIKEEEMEYEIQQPINSNEKSTALKPYNQKVLQEKEEVNSIYISNHGASQKDNLTHSCIATPHKGILKRSLHEIQTNNLRSQGDIIEDKNLYIELEKQKKLRRDLERSYKQLLNEIQRNQRQYDFVGEDQEISRKRQFSKRTLKYQKSQEGIFSLQELQPKSAKQVKKSDIKTTKFHELPKQRIMREVKTEEIIDKQLNNQENSHENEQQIQLQHPEEDEYKDFIQEQRSLQTKIIYNIQNLNKKVRQIQYFLIEQQRQKQKKQLLLIIQQREKQIKQVQQENEKLRVLSEQKIQNEHQKFDILSKMTPNSLYLCAIFIMVIVAIA